MKIFCGFHCKKWKMQYIKVCTTLFIEVNSYV